MRKVFSILFLVLILIAFLMIVAEGVWAVIAYPSMLAEQDALATEAPSAEENEQSGYSAGWEYVISNTMSGLAVVALIIFSYVWCFALSLLGLIFALINTKVALHSGIRRFSIVFVWIFLSILLLLIGIVAISALIGA